MISEQQEAAIRSILTSLDSETADRQYALEEIDRIVNAAPEHAAPNTPLGTYRAQLIPASQAGLILNAEITYLAAGDQKIRRARSIAEYLGMEVDAVDTMETPRLRTKDQP